MDENEWSFIRPLPDDVKHYVCEVVEIGLDEMKELERLKEQGSAAERKAAAQELENMGTPGEWFRKKLENRFPGFTEEQLLMLFSYGWRSTR